MRLDELLRLVPDAPWFDLPMLLQVSGEKREGLRVQLSRWMRDGKVIGLRRGVYTLGDRYRRTTVVPAALANDLYRPSYLSGLWALGYYDMIPERVVWFTSVTPRVPRRFENPFGVFAYHSIKREAFFGYVTVTIGGRPVLVAEPEKALLDHWHLSPGEWTPARLGEMRYQDETLVRPEVLRGHAERFRSPRLVRAAERWLAAAAKAGEGTIQL
jgi:hypothetical protein